MQPQAVLSPVKTFIGKDYASGIILFATTLAAMLAQNSALGPLYDSLLATAVEVRVGEFKIDKPLLLWINDGLMAIFFFHVGLEIKREVIAGKLADPATMVFPLCGALGGILCPALVYFLVNRENTFALHGWAIPTATDIAFALGVLALLGDRVPRGLKLFLLSLAVIDDLCAIVIIALFYTPSLGGSSLIVTGILLCVLYLFNRLRITSLAPYVLVGVLLWAFVLKSGIHATLAGVILALFIPFRERPDTGVNLLVETENDLKGSVYLVILPIFAFANSGIDFAGMRVTDLLRPIPLGITAGLLFGKQLGIFGFAWLAVKSGLAKRPDDINWKQLYGVALVCGVGFTMSLFISSLAFEGGDMTSMVDDRVGILLGSLLSGIAGFCYLRFVATRR